MSAIRCDVSQAIILWMACWMIVGAATTRAGDAVEMAPVISEIPPPIIGNEAIASPPNEFVYPDAFNLDTYVTDDRTTDGGIAWFYENAGGRYTINGVEPLNGRDPLEAGAPRIDIQDLDPGEVDRNPRTPTFRDTVYSPIGAIPVDPGTTGIVANEVVMLFASDGTTYSMREMILYTDNGGEDRLSWSHKPPPWPWPGPVTDWISASQVYSEDGEVTLTNLAGQGLCIEVPAEGAQEGAWISPYGFIELSAMTVYRIRVIVNSGNLPAGTTPLWGVTLDNVDNDGRVLNNKYGAEYLVLDNVGGANNVNGGVQYDFWFTPLPVMTDDWNDPSNGAFTAAMDPVNDARTSFRVLDVSNTGYGGELDAGRVCLEFISITSFDIRSLAVMVSEYDVTDMREDLFTVDDLDGEGNTGHAYEGGNLTIFPWPDHWDTEIITLTPGNRDPGYPGNPAEAVDNYPIVDTDRGLYRVRMGVQAPNAAAETQPPDAIRLGADDSTNEVLMTSNVVAALDQIGMPKSGSVSEYVAFYGSGAVTLDTTAGAGRIRPRADILCSETIGVGIPRINSHGVTITSMSMDRMVSPN